MTLELWTHDAWTGDEISRVDQYAVGEGASWSVNVAGTGDSNWVFKVGFGDDQLTGADLDRLFPGNARFLSLRWGRTVLGAWKVESWDYGDDEGTVIVVSVELRGEAKWRMTYGLSGYEAGTLSVVGRSRSGAVRAILARFMQWSPEWHYPIDLPADGAGDFTQTWEFWKKFTIEDLLTQIEDEGYEITLRPYLTSSNQLRFQTLVAKRLRTGVSSFNLQAAESPLGGVRYMKSSANQITGAQGLGEGTGRDQPVRVAGAGTFTIPIRDAKKKFPDLDGDRLQAATTAWAETDRNPRVQWTVGSFTLSDDYGAEHVVVTRGWDLESNGHPVFPDGIAQLRVVALSGTWSTQIRTEVQGVD